jgi:hypothetical protein
MVLSIRVHELLTQNSKNNLIQNDFKSLIPENDIPDKKQVYHKNMLEISEKTIELKKSKKLFQKKEEIIIDKIEDKSDVESDDLEDTLQFKLDDSDEENEEEQEENEVEVVEEKEDDEGEEEKEKEDKKLPDKDLMLDLIGIIEEKNKKEEMKDKEEPVEIEIKDNNTKKIVVDSPENIEQNGGNFKKIKLDQHYNFF